MTETIALSIVSIVLLLVILCRDYTVKEKTLRLIKKLQTAAFLNQSVHVFIHDTASLLSKLDIKIHNMKKTPGCHEVYKELQEIQQEFHRLFSYFRSNCFPITKYDLAAVIDRELAMYRVLHDDITFVKKYSGEIYVKCNAKISAALSNLFKNAVTALKDSPKKVLTITVSDLDSDHVLLSVHDSGHGIVEENLPRIWDTFFSTKDGSDTAHGLGMLLVRDAIESCGGKVLETLTKTGENSFSDFRFRIPRWNDKEKNEQN